MTAQPRRARPPAFDLCDVSAAAGVRPDAAPTRAEALALAGPVRV